MCSLLMSILNKCCNKVSSFCLLITECILKILTIGGIFWAAAHTSLGGASWTVPACTAWMARRSAGLLLCVIVRRREHRPFGRVLTKMHPSPSNIPANHSGVMFWATRVLSSGALELSSCMRLWHCCLDDIPEAPAGCFSMSCNMSTCGAFMTVYGWSSAATSPAALLSKINTCRNSPLEYLPSLTSALAERVLM